MRKGILLVGILKGERKGRSATASGMLQGRGVEEVEGCYWYGYCLGMRGMLWQGYCVAGRGRLREVWYCLNGERG